MPKTSGPTTQIHLQILEGLRRHPGGVTAAQLRTELGIATEEQGHFDRRIRQLRRWFHLPAENRKGTYFYVLGAQKAVALAPDVPRHLRAAVLRDAHGRCAMCGRTIEKHGIVLQVDHKIPITWGGKTELDNLWALCEDCNQGKKNQFASLESTPAKGALKYKSVHMRLGELLKASAPDAVPAWLMSFVANQSDWMKRVRDLRYLGWKIKVTKAKKPNGRVEAAYQLIESKKWPADPTADIAKYERERLRRNRAQRSKKS